MGIEIPRFCDHPLLAPAGACRQCLVEVEGQRKPVASCTQTVADGMVVRTQLTSDGRREGAGGHHGAAARSTTRSTARCATRAASARCRTRRCRPAAPTRRFHEHKREYPKPIHISTQVLLDRERCVLCQRCTRFSDEIAGDKFIDLMERSSDEQIGVYRDSVYGRPGRRGEPFNSYFSGNTIQICPVGALTGAQYRFRARPFDLVSSPSVCEHCAAGCAQRTDHRRGKVLRRLAGDDPAVNEEWNCDKGRSKTPVTERRTGHNNDRRVRAAGRAFGALGLPTVFVQEGGYDLDTIGPLVAETLLGFEEATGRAKA